jgi:hypothetical protein
MNRQWITRIGTMAVGCLMLGAGGCSKGWQDKLEGRWVGSSITNIPADQEGKATGWVKATTFEFHEDKMTVTIPAEEPRTGSYKVSQVNGRKLTLDVARPNGQADKTVVTFNGSDKLIWEIGQERKVTLVRSVIQ